MSPWTESHSELVQLFNIREGARLNFARVEFTPKTLEEAYLPETYTLQIDEERKPEWFTDEMKVKVSDKMRAYIKSIVVSGDVSLLVGGQFVIAPSAKIECAHTMLINVMCGGTVNDIRGGTVNYISGGTVNYISGGTVNDIRGGTVNDIRGGTIKTAQNIWNLVIKSISKSVKILDDKR